MRGNVALPVEREGVVLLRKTDEAGSKGLEVGAAPASQDSNDLIKTGGVEAGTGTSKDAVGIFSVMSGSVHGAAISRCVFPSGG
ncbi:hypothetical protein BJV77DRAFT_992319 [Russula vinacea]|nr:hypothetical protein BJV77DRAFT_992319 [Russula vinacea]